LVQPNNSLLLNLLALDAYAREDYKLAIQYWKRLLPQLDAQSEEAKKIVQAIAHAQSKLDI
jgi:cytochrome c-type biogenesis protein CcmH/NrfG